METSINHHPHFPLTQFHKFTNHHHHQNQSKSLKTHVKSAMPIRFLTSNSKQSSPNRIIQNLRFFCVHTSPNLTIMSEESKKNKLTDKETEETPRKMSAPPSPPEKPLPGDCCGNGCVPCVWDIYSDELEEYEKLRKEYEDDSQGESKSS